MQTLSLLHESTCFVILSQQWLNPAKLTYNQHLDGQLKLITRALN